VIRDQLPSLEGCAYLNAGTNGPLPVAAAEAARDLIEYDARHPRIGRPSFERFFEVRTRVRDGLAAVVGAPADQIALTSSTTQGIGLVTAGLPWQAGDEVVTTTEEHPGLLSPLDVLAQRFGVVVRAVDASDVLDAIGPKTRMVAVSHVLWTTGRVLDLPTLAGAIHAVGGTLLVDGAQSIGNIPVDVPATGADYYAFSGQKWLMGAQGSGGLWVHPDRVDDMWPVLSGYLALDQGQIGQFKQGAQRFDAGTIDGVTLVTLAASLEWVASLPGGRAAWYARAAENAARARELLAAAPGVRVAWGETGLVAFEVDRHECEPVAVALNERKVLVRFIPHTPYVRASVGAWTDESDLQALLDALRSLPAA
jgi:L-cysteine/cystine lyase